MSSLVHRIKVFVCRYRESGPEYLLLRRSRGIESFWGPLDGPIGFGEQIESAIRREALEDLGLDRPQELIDLEMPGRWVLGDEEIVEWSFGFRTLPDERALRLSESWADARWSAFPVAYPSLELEGDRAAITRLHTRLAG